jgi:hypothetical protein
MTEQIPDRFPVPFYTLTEILERGILLSDCVSREIKGCEFYMLKKDVEAEREWAKKRFPK